MNTTPISPEMIEAGLAFVCGMDHTIGKKDGAVDWDVLRDDLAAIYTAMHSASQGVQGDVVERVAIALHNHEWSGQPRPEPFTDGCRDYWMSAAQAAIDAITKERLG